MFPLQAERGFLAGFCRNFNQPVLFGITLAFLIAAIFLTQKSSPVSNKTIIHGFVIMIYSKKSLIQELSQLNLTPDKSQWTKLSYRCIHL